jgi:hypothetical protein
MTPTAALEKVRLHLDALSAVDVADLFLSPHIPARLLKEATSEAGPSLWIVNRSDVYEATLEALAEHALPDIAARAKEKLRLRRAKIFPAAPGPRDTPLEEVADYEIEDVLGHPLVPFDAIAFFARALNEDVRASAALSLTRRLVEFPPDWLTGDIVRESLAQLTEHLATDDPSPYVRSYAARIPLLDAATIGAALARERNPYVIGKLLQNPASTRSHLEQALARLRTPGAVDGQADFALRVLALDARLTGAERGALSALAASDPLVEALNDWHLSKA